VDGAPVERVADAEGCIAVDDAWIGKSISLVQKGSGELLLDSDAQSIQIPAASTENSGTGGNGGNTDGGNSGNSNGENADQDNASGEGNGETQPPAGDGGKDGISAIAIIAIVIGSVAVVGAIGAAVYLLVFKKKRS
jgi:hypothetical protein